MPRNVTAIICGDPPAWRAGRNVDCEDSRREAQADRLKKLKDESGSTELTIEQALALTPRRWTPPARDFREAAE